LLTNPIYFDVEADKIGYVTGMLTFLAMPGAILGCFFAGYLYDLFGRRFTIGFSLFCCSGLVALVPLTSPFVYPWLLVIRIAFSMFVAIPISNPLAADYI
jgi:MFS family permease